MAKIAAVAHHRPLARQGPDIPKTWNEFEGAPFPTKASMLVIEKLLEPADVSVLATADCALCAFSKDLTGTEVGLSIPGDEPERVQYMQGGIVAAQKHLAVPARGPDPGVILNPPMLYPGDTRFQEEQAQAVCFCNKCGQGPKDHMSGTWVDDDARDMLATSRPEAYRRGRNCKLFCGRCWIRRIEAKGGDVPDGATFQQRIIQ